MIIFDILFGLVEILLIITNCIILKSIFRVSVAKDKEYYQLWYYVNNSYNSIKLWKVKEDNSVKPDNKSDE